MNVVWLDIDRECAEIIGIGRMAVEPKDDICEKSLRALLAKYELKIPSINTLLRIIDKNRIEIEELKKEIANLKEHRLEGYE